MQENANKQQQEPWLLVEPPTPQIQEDDSEIHKSHSTHITLQPPNDSRKRAIERFGFTKVFQEEASQLDVFEETGAVENIQNVLKNGRDGLIATLGVTGSGKVGRNREQERIVLTVSRATPFSEHELSEESPRCRSMSCTDR